jgi:thiol-disulfide isomerase/thioredoxin
MLKNIFITLSILFVVFTTSAQKAINKNETQTKNNTSSVSISITLKNASGKKIYMERFENNTTIKIDSATADKKNRFNFKKSIQSVDFYRFTVSSPSLANDFFVLILSPGEKVMVDADANNLGKTYQVSGSVHSEKLRYFNHLVVQYIEKRDSLQMLVREYSQKGDYANAQRVNNEAQAAYVNFQQQRDIFLEENINSPAILGVLSHIDTNNDLERMKKIEAGLAQSMPGSQYHESVKALVLQTEKRKQAEEEQRKQQQLLLQRIAPGKEAPEIEMNLPDGKPLKLSSLRGNYVLIDFWASWCGPCRKENPNVVRIYEKYKNKGFTIYSVSIDHNRDNWLAAIEKDKLTWKNHVSSLQGWQTPILKEYGVNGVPFTVLLDKEGKIIETNLRGEHLENKLREIFGY